MASQENDVDQAVAEVVQQGKRRIGFWQDGWNQLRLVWRLFRDPEVPIYLKVLPLLSLVYLIWPLDLFQDFIPVLGQLDDLTALLLGFKLFVTLTPAHLVERHRAALRAEGRTPDAGAPGPETIEAGDLAGQIVLNPERQLKEKSPH